MKKSVLFIGSILAVAGSVSHAAVVSETIELTHEINASANIYYTNWGHAYNQNLNAPQSSGGPGSGGRPGSGRPGSGGPGSGGPGSSASYSPDKHPNAEQENYALSTGVPARAVTDSNGAFNFSNLLGQDLTSTFITISVNGFVRDNGTLFTGADGCQQSNPNNCGHVFRGQTAYSVIGMWSSTADTITRLTGSGANPFAIGTGIQFDLATLSHYLQGGPLYLFLGNNDGEFSDNPISHSYSAVISYSLNVEVPAEVPVPAAGLLLGSALIGLSAVARRRRIA